MPMEQQDSVSLAHVRVTCQVRGTCMLLNWCCILQPGTTYYTCTCIIDGKSKLFIKIIKHYIFLLMGVARSPGRSASLIHSARDEQVRGTAESLGSLSTSRPGPSEQTRSFLCIPSDTF